MNSNLLFDEYQEQDEDLAQELSKYTTSDLRSNLLRLIHVNVVYSYCESLIVDNVDSDLDIGSVIDYYRFQKQSFSCPKLPWELLLKLKTMRQEIQNCDLRRQDIISLILNLIIENTLLYSSLAKFVDR